MRLTTHNGTHVDAPWHYHPTMNEGERAATIDEMPLEWFFQRGVKLDFRHFADGYVATAADIEAELKRIGHKLAPLDIVIVNTSAGAKYGRPDYLASGCGMGAEATLFLLRRGVRVTGTDGWSWDAPFVHTARRYAETHDPSIIWEGHKAGRHIGYCHIEKLHNLEALPRERIHGRLLSREDRTRLRRVDAGRRDHRGVTGPISGRSRKISARVLYRRRYPAQEFRHGAGSDRPDRWARRKRSAIRTHSSGSGGGDAARAGARSLPADQHPQP